MVPVQVSNTQDLLKETHTFYKTLFSGTPCDDAVRRQFLSDNIPKLSSNDRKSCEGAITEREISKAIKDMGMISHQASTDLRQTSIKVSGLS